jgi:uncharacterized protein YkwD
MNLIKKSNLLLLKIIFLLFVVISIFLLNKIPIMLPINNIKVESKVPEKTKAVPSKTLSPTTSAVPTSTSVPTLALALTPVLPKKVEEFVPKNIIDEKNNKTEDPDNIISAINSYRQNKNLNNLSSDPILCEVAGKRAGELLQLGSLDNHDGWGKYGGTLSKFSSRGEIIAYTSFSANAEYFVNSVWANSSQHAANMANPEWAYGCGAIVGGEKGYFATFEFGKY